MSYQEVLSQRTIAISTSDSPDMPSLGLSEEHLKDATVEIARHLLALGARLYYGGDLRANGFSELLFELVERHKRDSDDDDDVRTDITNLLAWPVHLRMSFAEIESSTSDLVGFGELVCLDISGARQPLLDRQQIQQREPSEAEWKTGLTTMRTVGQSETSARIVLGGRVENFKGSMPGIAEEALMSLSTGKPLYLLGGFGGCARDIAETLKLIDPWAPLNRDWSGRELFEQFTIDSLNNGLTTEQNRILARTPHIDQAIILILTGLVNIDK